MMTALILLLLSKILNRGIDTRPDESHIAEAWQYVQEHGMDTHVCILVDYSIPSGCNRLWVWDFDDEEVMFACPVAHGRGRKKSKRSEAPQFGNEPDSWLSSLGKARIGECYHGRYGTAYRLDGLEESNSNLRKRCIVLHGHNKVPEKPIFPLSATRSRGCVMVAQNSMEVLNEILHDRNDVLLSTFCSSESEPGL